MGSNPIFPKFIVVDLGNIKNQSHCIRRIWSNNDINEAISSIRFGENWPDDASATAYKNYNRGDYLK